MPPPLLISIRIVALYRKVGVREPHSHHKMLPWNRPYMAPGQICLPRCQPLRSCRAQESSPQGDNCIEETPLSHIQKGIHSPPSIVHVSLKPDTTQTNALNNNSITVHYRMFKKAASLTECYSTLNLIKVSYLDTLAALARSKTSVIKPNSGNKAKLCRDKPWGDVRS